MKDREARFRWSRRLQTRIRDEAILVLAPYYSGHPMMAGKQFYDIAQTCGLDPVGGFTEARLES
jgi:hypothetical protein